MAKKYIDADKLQVEIARYYDEYKGKFKSTGDRYYLGLSDGLDVAERVIDTLRQEQPCDTCTNDKGCVTCKDGELWEGKEQPSEDLEAEIKRYEASLPESATVDPFEGHPTLEDIARHFANWQKEQMIRDCSVQASYEAEIEKAEERGYNLCKEQMPMPEDTVLFQKGVEEGKRLMLEDAVEGTLGYGPHLQRPIIMLEEVPTIWDGGCKPVRIIVLKAEED